MIKNSLEIKSKDKSYQVTMLNTIDELIEEINSFSNVILIVDDFIFKNNRRRIKATQYSISNDRVFEFVQN